TLLAFALRSTATFSDLRIGSRSTLDMRRGLRSKREAGSRPGASGHNLETFSTLRFVPGRTYTYPFPRTTGGGAKIPTQLTFALGAQFRSAYTGRSHQEGSA